jgi:hypothetical protein
MDKERPGSSSQDDVELGSYVREHIDV